MEHSLTHRDSHWAPRLGAAVTALVGLVNIASALTPDIRWRGHLLLQVEALQTMRFFHALALPAGVALLLVAPYLLKRRRRALEVAIAVMLVLGIVNLLKGLDFAETLLGWFTAAGLYRCRAAFDVEHDPITLRSAVWRVPLLGLAGLVMITLADWVAQGQRGFREVVRESVALARFHHGPLAFKTHTVLHQRVSWIPLGVHMVETGTLLAIAYVIFRPMTRPRVLPGPTVRRLAAEVVRRHGEDTLSFFKLRQDKFYFFSDDRKAFVGYRIEAGVLLLSGDPVGPAGHFPGLLTAVCDFARARGLRIGAIGASEALLPIYQGLGLQRLYLGDEAIVELESFSLEGRAIRKVRQSVSRLTKAGFSSELRTLADLDTDTVEQIERVLVLGRLGKPEIGFSMGMDSIHGEGEQDTRFVLARDGEGTVRGVLHFVPCYGRPAVSLSMMRRDPETPNGLTEFLVCEAVTLLRAEGLTEMSLNFATAARYLHDPHGVMERGLGWFARTLNPYFQIESLYRFNAKFFPRWEPRYAVYQGRLGLPRMFLAGMWAEGQIQKPPRPKFLPARRPRGRRGLTAAS